MQTTSQSPQNLDEKKWKEGVIEEMVDGNIRSYHVISDGVTYRRNRQDLNKSVPQVPIKIHLTNLPMCYIELTVSANNQNGLKIMSHHNCVHA